MNPLVSFRFPRFECAQIEAFAHFPAKPGPHRLSCRGIIDHGRCEDVMWFCAAVTASSTLK